MQSTDVPTLQDLVNAAGNWQTQAATKNVVITIITATINGEPVTLAWEPDQNRWHISAT